MTNLYNTSLVSGYCLLPFKTALVALIPKPNKDLIDPKNNRPISLLETLERRLKTVLVTKDAARAFDTVWHAGLKYKLCTKVKVPSCTKKLLSSFLDDRKLKLKFKGKISDTIHKIHLSHYDWTGCEGAQVESILNHPRRLC
ncbi:uncharacterized protein LOC125032346 [Penaeus chinensis]|uniref:uncharacterized protein LOC125032346 n=1 Tax=Penaeus chinensis TaxID=139456 RepID=UPI001FB6E232|nr:uncharacterized protein LOC125032346 [Penaeus chinensis]